MTLLEALNIAKSCISSGDIVQVLSHICIHNGEIIAYNGGQAVVINSQTEELEDISCAVPGDIFIKLLNSLPSVVLEQHPDHLRIICKKTKTNVKLASIKRKRFIFKEGDIDKHHMDEDKYICINEAFIDGLSKCITTTKDDDSKIEQTGITVISDRHGVTMYSTDSVQMSRYKIPEITKKYVGTFMIPKPFCQTLITFSSLVTNFNMWITDDSLLIRTDDVAFFSHLISDISFMPFDNVIRDNYSDDVAMYMFKVPEKLSNSLERCMLMPSTVDKKIVITTHCDNSNIELLGSSDIGEMRESVTIKCEPGDIDDNVFTANGLFLKDMLTNVTEMGFNKKDNYATTVVGVNKEDTFLRILACFSPIETHISERSEGDKDE